MNDNLTMVGDGIILDNNNDCNIDKNFGANDKNGVDSNNSIGDSNDKSSKPSHDPIYDAETDEDGSIVPFACVSADSVYDVETDGEGGNTNW